MLLAWVAQHLPHNPSPPPQEPGGNHTPPQLSPSVGQAAYTAGVPGGSLDVQHLIMQADARRRQRSNDNYFEDVPRSKLERQMAQVSMVRKGTGEGWSGVDGSMNGGREGVIRHASKYLRPICVSLPWQWVWRAFTIKLQNYIKMRTAVCLLLWRVINVMRLPKVFAVL